MILIVLHLSIPPSPDLEPSDPPRVSSRTADAVEENESVPKGSKQEDKDEFIISSDKSKGDSANDEGKRANIMGLIQAAQGLLKQIGLAFLGGSASAIFNFARNSFAVRIGTQAVSHAQTAVEQSAELKSSPDGASIGGLARAVLTTASTIVGFAQTATQQWLNAIKNDQQSQAALNKNADRA